MYITSVPNHGSKPTILIRQSVRTGKKVKTITIANITKWKPERIEALKRALKGEFDGLTTAIPTSGKIFGLIFVLNALSLELGINKALGNSKYGKLALFLVLARIAHQGSRLSAVRWSKNHGVKELLGVDDFDENDLYNALDYLSERQEKIELSLYNSYLKRTKKPTRLVLYDVTSSYFEGTQNELAEYGYNRDGKTGKKQIVIGLLTSDEGEPLSVRVFKGNTSDCTTVADQIHIIKNQYKIQDVIFVGDRGMIKAKGKQVITEESFHYITAITDPQILKLLKNKVVQLSFFDEDIQEIEYEGKRLILRKNTLVAETKSNTREKNLEKLQNMVDKRNKFVANSKYAKPESGLKRIQEWLDRRKMKWIDIKLDNRKIVYTIIKQEFYKASLLDGCYIMETNVSKDKLTTKEVDQKYRNLQQVEKDFRTLKTTCLEIRPIFLRKTDRTKAHVFIAMLALKISRLIENKLKNNFGTTNGNPHNPTLDDALGALSRIIFLKYELNGKQVSRLTKPDNYQQSILKALGIKFPNKKSVVINS